MKYDAFTGGVEPGGLRFQNDIKILVCYMIKNVPSALNIQIITEILQTKGLANYFEINDAIQSLLKSSHISQDENLLLKLEATGEEISSELEETLPLVVKEKALKAAFEVLKYAKIEKENKVEIEKTKNGYNVHCHVSGGDFDLMELSIFVPDYSQAKIVKKNFHRDPEQIYKLMLNGILGNDLA